MLYNGMGRHGWKRTLKKNKNKVVSNRCNRCVDSSRDHTNNEMASQYFFRLGKHTPRPDDAAIFRFCLATISSFMATCWKGVLFLFIKKKFFFLHVQGVGWPVAIWKYTRVVLCSQRKSWTGKKTTCKREGYGRFKRISSGTPELGRCG